MSDDVIPLNKIGKIGTVKVYNQAYVDKQQKRIEELTKWLSEASDEKLKLQMLRVDLVLKIGKQEKRIAELEAQNEILERRIIRAKECMKKLLFIINSEPSNYNCKGLVQDAEDFIYNKTCNIRKSGNHCITEEPCIMCDK